MARKLELFEVNTGGVQAKGTLNSPLRTTQLSGMEGHIHSKISELGIAFGFK